MYLADAIEYRCVTDRHLVTALFSYGNNFSETLFQRKEGTPPPELTHSATLLYFLTLATRTPLLARPLAWPSRRQWICCLGNKATKWQANLTHVNENTLLAIVWAR